MEQLQPILKHKFWIIFGIALVLPIVGWFLATGQAKEYIDERVTKISGTNVQSGASQPNEQWTASLKKVNERETSLLNTAAAHLWEEQKQRMVWPPNLRRMLQNHAYRDPIGETALNWYVQLYEREHERVRQIVRPYDFETDQGIVHVPPNSLHIHPNYAAWLSNPGTLTSDQMWDAQEDLWLLAALLTGIDNTNRQADASSIAEAYVRQIDRIELRGGLRAPEGGAAPTDSIAGAAGGAMGHGAESSIAGMAQAYGGGMGQEGGGGTASVSFDVSEEFGSDAVASTGTDGDLAADATGIANAMGAASHGAGPAGFGGAAEKRRRYIDDEELPFRTRGFYMELVIDHTKLPELIGELASLPWPVEIVRVQQGEFTGSGGATGSRPAQRGVFGGGGGNPFMRGSNPMGGAQPLGGGPMGGAFNRPAFGGAGAFGGRPPRPMAPTAGPFNRFNPMPGVGATSQQRQGEKYRVAMQDPILARVAIAGLMTLFESPSNIDPGGGEEIVPAETAPAASTDAPAAGAPAVDAAPPADPSVPVPGTEAPPAEALPADAAPPGATPDATAPLPSDPASPTPGEQPADPAADQPVPPATAPGSDTPADPAAPPSGDGVPPADIPQPAPAAEPPLPGG